MRATAPPALLEPGADRPIQPGMDPLFATVEYALGGLQHRLDLIADNVANANTTGYRSKRVEFEAGLSEALAAGKPVPERSAGTTGGSDLVDGNGTSVSLENELTDLAKTSLSRQVLINAFNYKVGALSTAAGAP
jgi:flagellar basal-body rod protein FlgB